MVADVEPIKEFRCTFKGCYASFDKANMLRSHKKHTQSHEFCSKCNEDFDSWDSLTVHKATDKRHEKEPICKTCGEEFKSVSGMRRHVALAHPIDQNLSCLGCGEIFTRAATLLDHLENGRCKRISAQQFASHLQHKNIVNKLLKDPSLLEKLILRTGYQDAARDDDVDGGVSLSGGLLEEEDCEQGVGLNEFTPLEPEKHPDSINPPRFGECWPALKSSQTHPGEADNDIDALSSRTGGISLAASVLSDTVDWNKARLSGMGSTASSISSRNKSAQSIVNEESNITQKVATYSAWVPSELSASTSEVLFAGAKPTPITIEWTEELRRRDHACEQEHGINLFRSRFWDPTSKGYNPDRFLNPIVMRYMCPLPHCECQLETPLKLETHIVSAHHISEMRCPSCLKLFKSSTALVAHCEAPLSRCHISKSNKYGQAIDEFSGGFLSARHIVRPEVDVDKDNHIVGYNQYESTQPPDWKEPGQELEARRWVV